MQKLGGVRVRNGSRSPKDTNDAKRAPIKPNYAVSADDDLLLLSIVTYKNQATPK